MSALDHDIAAELRRRLQLADAHRNEAHALLALAHAGMAIDGPLVSMPETSAALQELLRRISMALDPENPDLTLALGFDKRKGQAGHAMKRAIRQLEDDALLRAVEAMTALRESEWAACSQLASQLGATPKAVLHRVAAARSISGNTPLLPETLQLNQHAIHGAPVPSTPLRAIL